VITLVLLFGGMFIAMIPSIATVGNALVIIGMFLLGLILSRFPFATPQTIMLIGIKKSILPVRIVALFMLAGALYETYKMLL